MHSLISLLRYFENSELNLELYSASINLLFKRKSGFSLGELL